MSDRNHPQRKTRFVMRVKNEREEWDEEYSKVITAPTTLEEFAQDIVDFFNKTLRPGELPRTLLTVTKL